MLLCITCVTTVLLSLSVLHKQLLLHTKTDGPLPDNAVRQLAVNLLTLVTIYMYDPKMKIKMFCWCRSEIVSSLHATS